MSLRHAILGFLDLEPTTGYTLAQRFEASVGAFWTATRSQIYRELHALHAAGLVTMDELPQAGKPARKVYALTAGGRAALRRWLESDAEPMQLRDPFQLRLVFAAGLEPGRLTRLLQAYDQALAGREADYRARLAATEIFALARSEREAALWRLSIDSGLRWCRSQRQWVAAALRELAGDDGEARPRQP